MPSVNPATLAERLPRRQIRIVGIVEQEDDGTSLRHVGEQDGGAPEDPHSASSTAMSAARPTSVRVDSTSLFCVKASQGALP